MNTPEDGGPPLRSWLSEPPPRTVREALERLRAVPGVARIAVMPDVHLAEDICVGVVLATRGVIYPAAVGGDIGCGITAARLSGAGGAARDRRVLHEALARMRSAVPIMRHRCLNASAPLPLDHEELSAAALRTAARRTGRIELGTLGRGNHFLELQLDDADHAWLMVHSGSRGMGQAITRHHTAGATHSRAPARLECDTPQGRAYLADAAWACRYASASRLAMVRSAAAMLEPLTGLRLDETSLIDCSHNHVRVEDHFGEQLLVHRKGASPAALDEPGLIPGAMGRESFHVSGRGDPESLRSSSHGAGRAMSRSEARRRVAARELHRQGEHIVFDERLAGSLTEEAPAAYKDIRAVMRAQRNLVRITRTVRGVLCYKGV